MFKRLGEDLLKVRQSLSRWTHEHVLECCELSKYDYLTKTLYLVENSQTVSNLGLPLSIPSYLYRNIQVDVYTAYSNRLNAIKREMSFKSYKRSETHYYKCDYKDRKTGFVHKKGSLRKIEYESYETDLTKTVTRLAKHGVHSSYEPFMERIIDKFGIDRLMALALLKRENTLRKYPDPINFTSLTFRGRSRLTTGIVNRNKDSIIEGFITLSWPGIDSNGLVIPVKYHSKYHGDLKDYCNGSDTSYTVVISRNSVRIILTKDGDRFYPDVSLKEHVIEGADVNVKHNMVRFESGHEIAHNHKLVKATLEHEKRTDELKAVAKKRSETYELGKRRKAKSDALSRKYDHYIEREAVDTCKMLYAQAKRHLVFENLQGSFGKSYATSDIYDVNHNRLTSAMHISSVKDIFMRIAPKYGLSVSLVNPAYTSQTCPRCGCVDNENRLTQEDFECIECGYKDNADGVGAWNTGFRIKNAVLRDELSVLNENKTGFVPRKMKYKEIKSVINKCRPIVWDNPDVENLRRIS